MSPFGIPTAAVPDSNITALHGVSDG